MSHPHVHVCLLSGFLGAGKTTLLRRLLEHHGGSRVAVLKNEVGSADLDARIVRSLGVEVREVTHGSIFCSCRHDTFIEAMKDLAAMPIDMLFIEGSGIADPATFPKDLHLLMDLVGPVFHHVGSACLVDCTSFLELVDDLPAMENQVKHATVVLLNKIDLVSRDDIHAVREAVKRINPDVPIVETAHAAMDETTLASITGPACLPAPGTGTNTASTRPFVLVLGAGDQTRSLDPARVRSFLDTVTGDTLRVKGFFRGPGGGWHQVDGVQDRLWVSPVDVPPGPQGVVLIFRPGCSTARVNDIETRWQQDVEA